MTADLVDAHHHLWDVRRRSYPWMSGALAPLHRTFTIGDLERETAACGVAQTIVVQAAAAADETRDLLDAALRTPTIAGVVGWVDLRAPDVAEELARLRARPGGEALVGIRHQVHDEPDPDWLVRDDVLHGLQAVSDSGLAFDLLVRARELPAARRAVAGLESLTVVLDHVAKPPIASRGWEPWASEVAALAQLPNVSCKLSGLVTEAVWGSWRPADLEPYVDWALRCFGAGRLMFGSDWPVCLLAAQYGDVVGALTTVLAGIDAAAVRAVFAETARRVYRLPVPAGPEPAPSRVT